MTLALRRLSQAALLLAVLAVAPDVRAVQYDTDIDIDTEQDLYDLAARGEIEASDLETLVDLLREGIDLNVATREEIYELPGLTYEDVDEIVKYRELTRIEDPADLVSAQAISQEALLQIAPFLILEPLETRKTTGQLRLMSAYTLEDVDPPPARLQARTKLPYSLSAGLGLVTTRQIIGDVGYDLNQGGLNARDASYQVHLPKIYAQWKTPHWHVVAGSYRIGFGQRLTLDVTSRQNPNGIVADDVIDIQFDDLARECSLSGGTDPGNACGTSKGLYVTPDFTWRESLRGVAASAKAIPLGIGDLSVTGFGSYQTRSIYQYELYSVDECSDPHNTSELCKAPPVYLTDDPTRRKFAYTTLPDMYDEVVGGGNMTLTFRPGTLIGVTGYWANDIFHLPTALDFQEWSSRPYGGPFGAVGVNAAARAGRFNLMIEGTRSFDSMPGGGGGYGVVQRTVANVQKVHEVEFSLRYYAKNFLNPLARPVASFDEFEGQRARNEAGLRLRYKGKPNEDWRLRFHGDLSTMPEDGAAKDTAGTTNLDLLGRLDFVGWHRTRLAGWVMYKNKDVAVGGRGQCYETQIFENEDGVSVPCAGELWRAAARVDFAPLGRLLGVAAQAALDLLDDPGPRIDSPDLTLDGKTRDGYRKDVQGWLELTSMPTDYLRIRWKIRYLDEDVGSDWRYGYLAQDPIAALDDTYKEHSVSSFIDLTWLPTRLYEARVRYEALTFLDNRDSTKTRQAVTPFENRFLVDLKANF